MSSNQFTSFLDALMCSAFVMCVGIIGNGSVIMWYLNSKTKTSAMYYIFIFAIVDIATCLLVSPQACFVEYYSSEARKNNL